jgi:hypothetical protein
MWQSLVCADGSNPYPRSTHWKRARRDGPVHRLLGALCDQSHRLRKTSSVLGGSPKRREVNMPSSFTRCDDAHGQGAEVPEDVMTILTPQERLFPDDRVRLEGGILALAERVAQTVKCGERLRKRLSQKGNLPNICFDAPGCPCSATEICDIANL